MVVNAGKESELLGGGITKGVVVGAIVLSLGTAAPALAAPEVQKSAQATISELEAQGFRPILNKVGNAPLEQCTVIAVRDGTAVKHSWIQRGPTGNVGNLVRYKTAYVDLMCNR
ncbi:hypothetical protein [Mycobacterium sp. 360MFTsu5.1]|uniref:hypothetical protein n=1 Tax=Mycobacterium sp. 360MFTsu5.1 TaxID=1172186 RepID=UPI001E39D7AD|nr:hypothetical protein [Mycobacterium sp. 360MFTsu5.1]